MTCNLAGWVYGKWRARCSLSMASFIGMGRCNSWALQESRNGDGSKTPSGSGRPHDEIDKDRKGENKNNNKKTLEKEKEDSVKRYSSVSMISN